MWHKLREIFGYKDNRRQQTEVTNYEMKENTVENNIIEKDEGSNENSNQMSGNVTSGFQNSSIESINDKSLYTKYREKFEDKDCFECKVTVSVVTFVMMVHVCRSLWIRRVHLQPEKVKYVFIANISLVGLWLSLMKREWFDKKQDTVIPNNTNISTLWDRYK